MLGWVYLVVLQKILRNLRKKNKQLWLGEIRVAEPLWKRFGSSSGDLKLYIGSSSSKAVLFLNRSSDFGLMTSTLDWKMLYAKRSSSRIAQFSAQCCCSWIDAACVWKQWTMKQMFGSLLSATSFARLGFCPWAPGSKYSSAESI